MIVVEARAPCTFCGYLLASLAFPLVRVNKCSLRQDRGTYLWIAPGRCPECGSGGRGCGVPAPLAAETFAASPWALTAKSLAEVESYRARRWPG